MKMLNFLPPLAVLVCSSTALWAGPISVKNSGAKAWQEVSIEKDTAGRPYHLVVKVTYDTQERTSNGTYSIDSPVIYVNNDLTQPIFPDGLKVISASGYYQTSAFTLPLTNINFFDSKYENVGLFVQGQGGNPKLILKLDRKTVEQLCGINQKPESDFDRLLKQKASNSHP